MIQKDISLTYIIIIDPVTDWFGIVEAPLFGPNEVAAGNDEYIDKYFSRVSHLFNNTWLCRYPCPL